MNVRRRSCDMGGPVGSAVRNTVNKRVDGPTQVKKLKNTVSDPRPAGVSKIKGAVNGPNG